MAKRNAYKRACSHHKPSKLGYLKWHTWAEEMNAKGIEQTKCSVCQLWFFPEEMNDKNKPENLKDGNLDKRANKS